MTFLLVLATFVFLTSTLVFSQPICNKSYIPSDCEIYYSNNFNQYTTCQSTFLLNDKWFLPKELTWNNTGWWNQANTVEVLLNYANYSETTYWLSIIESVCMAYGNTFRTLYFDDIQWWVLAQLRVYEFTQDPYYLNISEYFYNFVWENAWDDVCQGGFWWNDKKQYKNAITNELGIMSACKLYYLTKKKNTKSNVHNYMNGFCIIVE